MIFNRVVSQLQQNKLRRETGNFNCIPWGLPRFESQGIYGIQQGKYYIVTGSPKAGKTQIADHLFMYNPYRWINSIESDINIKIFYFSLEMSKEEKILQAVANKLAIDSSYKYRYSPNELKSIPTNFILSDELLSEIVSKTGYFEEFLNVVTFIDNIKNPTGIFLFMKDYARKNGTVFTKKVNINGEDKEVFDYYVPNDPNEYVLFMIDHASLLNTETKDGRKLTIKESIDLLSSNYLIELRNYYNQIPVLIQQQASNQESIENEKFDRLRPTQDGLAESKLTSRDCNSLFGIFSPYRHKIPKYPKTEDGYDIRQFKDNIRFLEVILSRDGGAGAICPLLFDGATNYFKELPPTSDAAQIRDVIRFIEEKIRR